MTSPAVLLKESRAVAGLSVRALAESAGVSASTVSRIESGRMDPTVGMLAKLLEAAGQELEVTARPWHGIQLASLADAWHRDASGQDRPDWTRLRVFLDRLALEPTLAKAATAQMPSPSGSAFFDNLLAGMAEKVCDDGGLPRPSWTHRVSKLKEPWISPGTPRMQARAVASTPEQLSARGITLRADSLWRNPKTVGL